MEEEYKEIDRLIASIPNNPSGRIFVEDWEELTGKMAEIATWLGNLKNCKVTTSTGSSHQFILAELGNGLSYDVSGFIYAYDKPVIMIGPSPADFDDKYQFTFTYDPALN